MNYGLLDAHNLAWKLHLVESGLMQRGQLQTYEQERRQAAGRLIEFDATYAGLFSSHDPSDHADAEFVRIYKQNAHFASGYGVEYPPNDMTWHTTDYAKSPSLQPGHSLPPMDVKRVIDAWESSLEQEIPFNGCFRVYIFAGQQSQSQQQALQDLATHLADSSSVFTRFQRRGGPDNSYESRYSPCSSLFTFALIFNVPRASVEIRNLPSYFLPYRYLIYSDDARHTRDHGAAHRKMGFDPAEGGVVVARPDGYVGCIVRLVQGRYTAHALEEYFGDFVPAKSD